MEHQLTATRLLDEITKLIAEQTVTQPLQRDNKTVWKSILHRYRNEEWAVIVGVLWMIMADEPQHFKKFHVETLLESRTVLVRDWDLHPRILDTRAHKGLAWKLMLTAYEVYASVRAAPAPAASPISKFKDLFE